MRARFIPRILAPTPESLLDEAGDNFDPEKILAAMMRARSPAATASARSPSAPSRWRSGTRWRRSRTSRCIALLAERFSGGHVPDKMFCYVGGGWYCAGPDHRGTAGRDARAISMPATPW